MLVHRHNRKPLQLGVYVNQIVAEHNKRHAQWTQSQSSYIRSVGILNGTGERVFKISYHFDKDGRFWLRVYSNVGRPSEFYINKEISGVIYVD